MMLSYRVLAVGMHVMCLGFVGACPVDGDPGAPHDPEATTAQRPVAEARVEIRDTLDEDLADAPLARPETSRPGGQEHAPPPGALDDTDTTGLDEIDALTPDAASADVDAAPVDVVGALAPTENLVVAVVSDLNGSYGSTTYGAPVHAAVARLIALGPDLVLSTGDMVAGQRAGLDYRAMWAAFHTAVSDPLAAAGVPFAVSPGNHDASGYSSFSTERDVYADEWSVRAPAVSFLDATHYPFRYSFTLGQALFVALDATTVGHLDDAQVAWIETQLIAGAHLPIKILFGHMPLYPFAHGREGDYIGDPALEAMVNAHGVTAWLSGHHHAYYPGRRGPLRLASLACLGSGPRALLGQTGTSPRSLLILTIAPNGAVALDAWGGPAFDQPIARGGLPASLGHGTMKIDRDDL